MIQGRNCAPGSAREVMNVLNAAIVSSIESNLAAAFGISVEGILGGVVYEVLLFLGGLVASPNVPRVAAKLLVCRGTGVS